MPGSIRAHGVWIEGYYDHERHENLNPGQSANPTRRMTSGGVVAGVDASQFTTGSVVQGHQFGFFSGYNSTRSKFTNTTDPVAGTNDIIQTLDARQEIDGAFAGMYGAVVHGPMSADLAFKVDFFNLEQRFIERNISECAGGFTITDTLRSNSTAMTNYMIASNANYRFDLNRNHYIEPTVGVRYTYTDFGGNAPAVGVKDGDVFRVQGGLRFGTRHATPDGWIWQTSLTGLLYSDVAISGFVVTGPKGPGLSTSASPVDEGKLRAMGILETKVDVGYGYTLYGDVNVRGGEDVFGFGSRLGVRYQW